MNYGDNIRSGELSCYGDYIITDKLKQVLVATAFDRSKIKVQGVLMNVVTNKFTQFRFQNCYKVVNETYKYAFKSIYRNRDRMAYGVIMCNAVGSKYLITTSDKVIDDVYSLLINNYTAPLLKRWIPDIMESLIKDDYLSKVDSPVIAVDMERNFKIHGQKVKLSDLVVYEFNLTQENLERTLTDLLASKKIYITEKPIQSLEFTNFDSYLKKYGSVLVERVEEEIETLSPLNGSVDSLALKTKRLYPQQAACINGIIALKKAGKRFGLMIEGMGVGKTIQGESVVESYYAEKWLKEHKGASLSDLYKDEHALNYRCVIMCPGHLVAKWKDEVESEIPYAHATVITDLKDLIALRERGRKRNGREFYIIGKDKAKLGTSESPIPNKVVKMRPTAQICMDCLEASLDDGELPKQDKPFEKRDLPYKSRFYYKKGNGKKATCPNCEGKRFHALYISNEELRGMGCPHCGKLLVKYSPSLKADADISKIHAAVLQPESFSGKSTATSVCYHCGGNLWGYDCKPRGIPKSSPWEVIKYFSTARKNKQKKAFVLKGYERRFVDAYKYGTPEILPHEYGIRRYPPDKYAKKYLKGFFDFCILDEVHKFEGFSSAQANAAHSFMKCSDFTLGLTGTISNGSAASFFSLLFRLNPEKMIKKGFSFSESSMMEFSKQYGVLESKFEDDESGSFNKSSRGKMIQAPRVKPGISPVLFVDFLLDCSVFLDLSDLSKYLPPLHEKVVMVNMPHDVAATYETVNASLKQQLFTKEGSGCLADILQFGLSYPDKPYNRTAIMSTKVEDCVLTKIENHNFYIDNMLPKEEKLIEIVKSEIAEGRNCFVYCSFTGTAETNVTGRLQFWIESQCNLKGRVEVLHSEKPKADEREQYIHERAAQGIKVFICNPKIVETGLDFCFTHKGVFYNYPTLIFYQMGYELATIWQASRRAYRLNQTQECRTYWMAYENTLQSAALNIMAQKQVATSAIQGKFSVDGLASLAKGVDARVQLAQALAKGDMSDRKSIENMFDVMAMSQEEDSRYDSYERPKTFYEITGFGEDVFGDSAAQIESELTPWEELFEDSVVQMNKKVLAQEEVNVHTENTDDIASVFEDLFNAFSTNAEQSSRTGSEECIKLEKPAPKKKATKKVAMAAGQVSIFDML